MIFSQGQICQFFLVPESLEKLCRYAMPTPGTGLRGVLPLEDRCSRVGTALALDAKRDGHGEGKIQIGMADILGRICVG